MRAQPPFVLSVILAILDSLLQKVSIDGAHSGFLVEKNDFKKQKVRKCVENSQNRSTFAVEMK